jgi:hypothetical protein
MERHERNFPPSKFDRRHGIPVNSDSFGCGPGRAAEQQSRYRATWRIRLPEVISAREGTLAR